MTKRHSYLFKIKIKKIKKNKYKKKKIIKMDKKQVNK